MALAARDYDGMGEAALVRLARDGDREAFRAIMQRCNQRLFRVARAVLGNDDEAEDALQETYLRGFAHLDEFRGDATVLTWLTAVMLNEARGRLRKRRNFVDLAAVDQVDTRVVPFPGLSASPDPEGEAGRSQARAFLESAIDGLPPDFRIVFILREIEGCDVAETARQLDVKPQTVKTRHFRAKQLLRREMEARLAAGMAGLFPFLGARCAALAERVLERLP